MRTLIAALDWLLTLAGILLLLALGAVVLLVIANSKSLGINTFLDAVGACLIVWVLWLVLWPARRSK